MNVKIKVGDTIKVKEHNRVCAETYKVDESNGELGFWDDCIFTSIASLGNQKGKIWKIK